MVLTDSHGISRAPYYLGYTHKAVLRITVTGLTPSLAGLSKPFTYTHTLTPPVRQNWNGMSHNPDHATPAGYHTWNGLA